MQMLDLLISCNSACRNQLLLRCLPQRPQRIEWNARHQAFRINVRVEEGGTERIESLNCLDRRNISNFAPTTHRNFSAARINGKDQLVYPDVGGCAFCEFGVYLVASN